MVSGKMAMAVWVSVLAALPQQPQDAPIIRMNVDLVQVDAVVTDRKGRHVPDLKPEDFEVRQDGKVMKITHFSYVRDAGPAAAPPPVARRAKGDVAPPPAKAKRLSAGEVRRTMALVVDDLGLSVEGVLRVKEALLKFVDERMEPGDLVAVLRTGGNVGTLLRFTTDKQQLRVAIQQIKFNFRSRVGTDSVRQLFDDRSAEELGGGKRPSRSETPAEKEAREREQQARGTRSAQAALDRDQQEASDNRERDHIAAGTLGVLRYLLQGIRPMPGRKSVVLLSESLALRQNDASTLGIWDRLRGLTDMASRSGVVFYSVDPRGQTVLGLRAEDQAGAEIDTPNPRGRPSPLDARRQAETDSRNGLRLLAVETGGLYLEGANDVSGLLGRAADDQAGYYLIGYRPEVGTFRGANEKAKYHDIKVRVTRPGLQARSRNGFYNMSEREVEAAPLTQEQRMAQALVSPFVAGEIGLQLTPVFDFDSKTGPSVLTMMHIDGKNLTSVDDGAGWRRASLNVLTTTFGDDGVMADHHQTLFKLRMNEARWQQIQKDGLIYTTTQPLKKSGAFQFRAVVGDINGNKLGSASEFIEVPNLKKGKLALSGILLMSGVGAQSDEEGVAAYTAGHPAIRHFRRGQKVSYGYKVLNATVKGKDGDPDLRTQVRLFRGDKEVFRSEPRALQTTGAKDKSRLLVGGVLQLVSQFEPGDYTLQLVVWDKLAKGGEGVAAQAIDFELE